MSKVIALIVTFSLMLGLRPPAALAEPAEESPSLRFVKSSPGFFGLGAHEVVLEENHPEVTPIGQLVGGPRSSERWVLLGPEGRDGGGLRARFGFAGQSHIQRDFAALLAGHPDASRDLALAEAAAREEDRYLLSTGLATLAAGLSLGLAVANPRQPEGYYAQFTVLFWLTSLVPAFLADRARLENRRHVGRAVRAWNWSIDEARSGDQGGDTRDAN